MFGDYFEEFIPAMYRHGNLRLATRRDMVFLGKENLLLLARFWEKHAKTRERNSETATRFEDRERAANDARNERFIAGELRQFAKEAESKPMIFAKPAFHAGDQVTYFMDNPDHFVSGALVRITNFDEENNRAIFVMRVTSEANVRLFDFEPSSFSLYLTKDFEYFCSHLKFFETYLSYYAEHITELDKAQRILQAATSLSPRFDPPGIA